MSCHPRWRLKHLVRVLEQALGAPGPHKKALDPLQTLISNYTGDDLSKRLKRFFKLIFVRELLDRLISAYKDRLLKHAPRYLNIRIVDASRPRDTEEQDNNGVSFPEFIHYYTDNESRRDPHIGNNMKSCAIRAQLITILLVTLRLCRRRLSPA